MRCRAEGIGVPGGVPAAPQLQQGHSHAAAILQVSVLVDSNGNGTADWLTTLVSGWDTPNGITWHNGSLYVAEPSKIWRLDNVDDYALAKKVGGRVECVACAASALRATQQATPPSQLRLTLAGPSRRRPPPGAAIHRQARADRGLAADQQQPRLAVHACRAGRPAVHRHR